MLPNQRIVTLEGPAHRIKALFTQLGSLVGQRLAEGQARPELEALDQALGSAAFGPEASPDCATVQFEHPHAAEAAALLSYAAWQFDLKHSVIEPTVEDAANEERGEPYTAVLLYPDYATGDYGADVKVVTAYARDPFEAAALCQRQAAEEANEELEEEGFMIDDPSDFRMVVMFPGDLHTVLDAPDLEASLDAEDRKSYESALDAGPTP